jgi:hypothetical protein
MWPLLPECILKLFTRESFVHCRFLFCCFLFWEFSTGLSAGRTGTYEPLRKNLKDDQNFEIRDQIAVHSEINAAGLVS